MEFRTFVPTSDRPGIALAVEVCLLNLQERDKSTTAIVLPPRYGKSDVARLIAIEARALGLISCAVIMTPWVALADQIKLKARIEEMEARYCKDAVAPPEDVSADILKGGFSYQFNEDNKGRAFWAMTIPQASQPASLESLCGAAMLYKTSGSAPLLAIIDEGQYLGGHTLGDQQWITVATRLVQSGAHVVVLTGTPDRDDKTVPFGFETREISRRDHHWSVLRKDGNEEKMYLDIYEGQLVGYELIADYKVSLKEAWDQDKPLILTKLHAHWCGFKSDDKEIELLSDAKDIRRALSVGLRNEDVIRQFIGAGIADVAIRRQSRADSAMLIFVGNDKGDEETKDYHARLAKRVAQQIWRQQFGISGKIVIATLDEHGDGREAAKIIRKFVDGDGDILVVKMMGSVGLDAPRIKTIVDLSTVRTVSNTTQRWLRACTTWGHIRTSTLVLPCDALTKALWTLIVEANNGGFKRTEEGTLLESKEIEPDEPDEPPKIGAAYRAGSSDATTRLSIDAVTDIDVDKVLAKTPVLIERHSRVEIAQLIKTGVINVPQDIEPRRTVVRDLAEEIDAIKDRINDLAGKIANKITPYMRHNGEEYRVTIQGVYIRIAERAGIHGGLPRCRDLDRLHQAELEAQSYLREVGG